MNVLVVDDDRNNRASLERHLHSEGFGTERLCSSRGLWRSIDVFALNEGQLYVSNRS